MTFQITFFGATEQVTGSLYLIRAGGHTVLLECGLIQGSRKDEARNREPFPIPPDQIDAVVLSHAHIDHSGRVPLLVSQGFQGPVYTQHATRALCEIMLPDSGYLNEKDAEWENKKRKNQRLSLVEPLYTRADAEACLSQFRSIDYQESREVVPGLDIRFLDAGHILGSAIVEMTCTSGGESRKLVFSGDLGYRDAPVMDPPSRVRAADMVLMESTYGDRLHRPYDETLAELGAVFHKAKAAGGNILIPAFAVGRTQDLLFLLAKHCDEWGLRDWQIFLDSPMAIEATEVYSHHRDLYDVKLFEPGTHRPKLPNFYATKSTEESMVINRVHAGAIIIAGSGMCSGGRIRHHLKNNVDGADEIKLWGDNYRVRSEIHTIGGLSAHADQADLLDWYGSFDNTPPVYLVHGESKAQQSLSTKLRDEYQAPVSIARYGQRIDINRDVR
jgi:metallo-beta-lactamase family protein